MKTKCAVLALVAVMSAGSVIAQDRLRPPNTVQCDRNHLTSFTGAVVKYQRNANGLDITVHTDFDTTESFHLRGTKSELEGQFLIGRQRFKPADWKRIESSPKHLKANMRATAWVCEQPQSVIVEWEAPKE